MEQLYPSRSFVNRARRDVYSDLVVNEALSIRRAGKTVDAGTLIIAAAILGFIHNPKAIREAAAKVAGETFRIPYAADGRSVSIGLEAGEPCVDAGKLSLIYGARPFGSESFLEVLLDQHARFGDTARQPQAREPERIDGLLYFDCSGLMNDQPRHPIYWLKRQLARAREGEPYDQLIEGVTERERETLQMYDALAAFFRDEAGFARSYAPMTEGKRRDFILMLAEKAQTEARRHAALRAEAAASLRKLFSSAA